MRPEDCILLGFAAVVAILGVWYILVTMIRDWLDRRKTTKALVSYCAGCVHLYFDKNDKAHCDLQCGGFCTPSVNTYYRDCKY